MKLRIMEKELRVRLSRIEIEQLAREGRLEQTTALLPTRSLMVALEADGHISGLTLDWSGDRLLMRMPAADIAAWVDSGQVGFAGTTATGVEVRVERDLKETRR